MTLDDALLAFYRLQERFEGVSPTVREFQEESGCASTSHAAYWLQRLSTAELIYQPRALMGKEFARTHKLSTWGRQRAYLLTEAVA